jgi:hypothetical protein
MSRPTKLNDDVRNRIVLALEAGNYQDTAAQYAGVSKAAFYNWMERGRNERDRIGDGQAADPKEAIFVEFVDAVENARASAEVRAVANIAKAANDGTWQASAWYLERSHPQRWGRFQRTEISGPEGGPIETTSRGEAAIVDALTRYLEGHGSQPDGPAGSDVA